jgi:hypothetical protein
VPALEPIAGLRVVAKAAALNGATWSGEGEITVVRIAPDEAFAIGAEGVEIDDPDAIVEPEPGFSAAHLDAAGLESVLARVEFSLPRDRPAFVQGKVAGVPCKLLLPQGDAPAVLVVQTAYLDDLEARLR